MASQTLCSIPGCSNSATRRGWCDAHYRRWRKKGDPMPHVAMKTPRGEARRFFQEVVLTYSGDACLFWPYATKEHGYGVVDDGNGTQCIVSRLVCEYAHGPAPTPKHEAAHSCGNGNIACCAMSHISWKTPSENTADKFLHGTVARGTQLPQTKLTEAAVREIRASTERAVQLALKYGVDRKTIQFARNGKSWAWV